MLILSNCYFFLIIFNFHSRKFPDCRFVVYSFKPWLYYLAWVTFWGSVDFEILPSIKRHFALWLNLFGHQLYSLSASILSFLAERGRFPPAHRVLAAFVIFKYSQLLINFLRVGKTCTWYPFWNIQNDLQWKVSPPFILSHQVT